MNEIAEKMERVETLFDVELQEIPKESMEKYDKLFDDSAEHIEKYSADELAKPFEVPESYQKMFGEDVDNVRNSDLGDKTENDPCEDNLDINEMIDNYLQDIKANSEYPDTIKDDCFTGSDLEKISPEENSRMREEFDEKKEELKKQWEEQHGVPWPKYDHDVYSSNGKLIRRAGDDYDAHHIQPLGLGGKNTVENITPLSAEKHYDKQGVHAPGSAYDKLCKAMGG
ncbi:MAG: hypothetical protein NC299_16200 [Lachnospiraceae bacterium]|nr:hypothetical protein [Ruminococcus sp.]MCM1276878.1 hypothetical protein [Lachnospiraceae bacterium]